MQLTESGFTDMILQKALESKIITPDDYLMENAVKSAYLKIYREGYLDSCTPDSVGNAVMDMVVQGLNPIKEQGYFIKYGSILKFMRSYMGSIAVAKRFDPSIAAINSEVIYGGDEFDFEIENGLKFIKTHKPKFENIRNDNIMGAYALALGHDGKQLCADLMTFDEIKISWKRSQKTGETQPILANGELNPKSDHAQQPARFCRRTIINRFCKTLFSVTDDSQLVSVMKRTDEETSTPELVQAEVSEKANTKLIDFDQAKENHGGSKDLIDINPDNSVTIGDPKPSAYKQAETITKLSAQLNQREKMMNMVSDFFNRPIDKLSWLTYDEAEEYISVLKDQIGEAKDQDPDWLPE